MKKKICFFILLLITLLIFMGCESKENISPVTTEPNSYDAYDPTSDTEMLYDDVYSSTNGYIWYSLDDPELFEIAPEKTVRAAFKLASDEVNDEYTITKQRARKVYKSGKYYLLVVTEYMAPSGAYGKSLIYYYELNPDDTSV